MDSLIAPAAPENLDFGTLGGADDYARYFELLSKVFCSLLACYDIVAAHQTHEAATVRDLLQRLLYTIRVLRVKYTHRPDGERSLWVDLTQSGFPNSMEINNLAVDVANREACLSEIASPAILKRQALDVMLQDHREPSAELCTLSRRSYLEMLDPARVFMPFTPGRLVLRSVDEQYRGYLYSWGCYDFDSNLAYIHLITFFQDVGEEPLEAEGETYREFVRVVESEGSRAPDVGTLALVIDDAIEAIHPKTLKRIKIGPLCSLLLPNCRPCDQDPQQAALQCPLQRWGDGDDFVLFFSDEVIMSQRQQLTRSVFAPQGRIREVFWIPEADPECYRRHASVVHHYVLLPHDLAQNIGAAPVCLPQMLTAKKFAYTRNGDVYDI